jgi:hypothetical protein
VHKAVRLHERPGLLDCPQNDVLDCLGLVFEVTEDLEEDILVVELALRAVSVNQGELGDALGTGGLGGRIFLVFGGRRQGQLGLVRSQREARVLLVIVSS